jgi:hypothetical protein|tara:strand:- start:2013 stop:2264 length:252 start_codon:yes stop_codon:yes gene_type:complete
MNIILLLCLIIVIYINYSTFEGYYNIRNMDYINQHERHLGPYVGNIRENNYGDSILSLNYKTSNINKDFYTSEIKKLVDGPEI